MTSPTAADKKKALPKAKTDPKTDPKTAKTQPAKTLVPKAEPVEKKAPPAKVQAPAAKKQPTQKKQPSPTDILSVPTTQPVSQPEPVAAPLPQPTLSMGWDHFVFEVDQAIKARYNSYRDTFSSHMRYEPFLTPQSLQAWESTLPPVTPASWNSLWTDLCHHHWNIIPLYKKHEPISTETIAWFAHAFAAQWADLSTAYKAVYKTELPPIPKQEDIEKNQQAEVWQWWQQAVRTHAQIFGAEYNTFWRQYMQWFFQQKNRTNGSKRYDFSNIDWRVQPPCGGIYRAYLDYLEDNPPPFVSQDKDAASPRPKERFTRNGPGPQREAPVPPAAPADSDVPRYNKTSFKPRKDTGEPVGRFERQDSAQRLEIALREAQEAVMKMKKNSQMTEFPLQPQNSFVRREQHVVVSAGGFGTESRGEGFDRYVCLVRVKN